jgi:hypothetical protein
MGNLYPVYDSNEGNQLMPQGLLVLVLEEQRGSASGDRQTLRSPASSPDAKRSRRLDAAAADRQTGGGTLRALRPAAEAAIAAELSCLHASPAPSCAEGGQTAPPPPRPPPHPQALLVPSVCASLC